MQDPITTLSTHEFSAATGQPVAKIARWLREGVIEGTKEGGKWRIPVDQLDRAKEGDAGSPADPGAEDAATAVTYSVEEFSDMTYLTVFGVVDWLRKGLLTGSKDDRGDWRVDGDNLESDRVKRLLRM